MGRRRRGEGGLVTHVIALPPRRLQHHAHLTASQVRHGGAHHHEERMAPKKKAAPKVKSLPTKAAKDVKGGAMRSERTDTAMSCSTTQKCCG